MSRNRKPLSEQIGHLTVAQQEERKAAENAFDIGTEHLDKPPDWLIDSVAIEEYERLATELKKSGLAGNLDRNNIALYCTFKSGTCLWRSKKAVSISTNPIPEFAKTAS